MGKQGNHYRMSPPTIDDTKRTLGERYAVAATGGRTDADVLLAAGYAAMHNANGLLGLALWRMKESKSRSLEIARRQHEEIPGEIPEPIVIHPSAFTEVTNTAANWLVGKGQLTGRDQLPKLRRYEAVDVARITLQWWLDDNCPTCEGRQHPTIPGTGRLDYGHNCPTCEGTGKLAVNRVIASERRVHAQRLAAWLDTLVGQVFADMAARLRPNLDL